MAVNVSILGLSRVGASLGLALTPREDLRVTGYDRDPEVARAAQRMKAAHRAEWNLINAIANADLVLLAAPLSEQPEILKLIAPELREGGVVASAGPLLGQPLAWAAERLPAGSGRYFIAGHPILSPALLHTGDVGLEAARADLFQNGLWAIAPASGCAPEAVKLVAELVRLLGAAPYFVDPAEHDGLAAAADALPAVLAWALFQAASASPGWSETRKVADRSFATATAALAEAELDALRHNRENILRYLDVVLAGLQAMRAWLAQPADGGLELEQSLAAAADQRAAWLAQRRKGEWEPADQLAAELPAAGEMVSRLFVGGLLSRKGKDKAGG